MIYCWSLGCSNKQNHFAFLLDLFFSLVLYFQGDQGNFYPKLVSPLLIGSKILHACITSVSHCKNLSFHNEHSSTSLIARTNTECVVRSFPHILLIVDEDSSEKQAEIQHLRSRKCVDSAVLTHFLDLSCRHVKGGREEYMYLFEK